MTETPPTNPPGHPPRTRAPSLVIVNTGDGKGKSTAAFGTMIRAVSRDWKVCVIQFLKSGAWRVGEEEIGRRLGVDWWAIGDGFTWNSKDMDVTQATAVEAWGAAKERIASGDYQMVLLDEITYPITWGWIEMDEVAVVLKNRPEHVNIIATGRDAPDELIALADTVTEMVKVKHAFDQGIGAKRGIDL